MRRIKRMPRLVRMRPDQTRLPTVARTRQRTGGQVVMLWVDYRDRSRQAGLVGVELKMHGRLVLGKLPCDAVRYSHGRYDMASLVFVSVLHKLILSRPGYGR